MIIRVLWHLLLRVLHGLYRLQSSLSVLLQPCQLLGAIFQLSRAHVMLTCKRQRKEGGMKGILRALSSCQLVKDGDGTFEVTRAEEQGGGKGVMKARHFSPRLRVLRAIDIDIIQTQGGDFLVEALSKTTTFIPSFVPFAPLIGLSFWWVPIMDRRYNYHNLCILRKVVQSHGYEVEESVVGGPLLGGQLGQEQEDMADTDTVTLLDKHRVKAQ